MGKHPFAGREMRPGVAVAENGGGEGRDREQEDGDEGEDEARGARLRES